VKPPRPEEIRRTRIAYLLTQAQSARLIHVTVRSWQQWEYGERRMHAAFWTLFRIRARQSSSRRAWMAREEMRISSIFRKRF
jgi:putative transcriptional regulator